VTVESARFAVESVAAHSNPDSGRSGGRPAHAAGLYLSGHLEPAVASDPFTSSVFQGPRSKVVVRLSPMMSGPKDRRLDLHGFAARIQDPLDDANSTDFVAMNTHPFLFRSADDFALFLARMSPRSRKKLVGLWTFGLAAVAGDASVDALANTIYSMVRANRSLTGLKYWGIHTFFADRTDASDRTVRVPYRYHLEICNEQTPKRLTSRGKVLDRYRDLAGFVNAETPLRVDLWFMLAWNWERLVDWQNVPADIRDQIINPLADWKHGRRIHMATFVLDNVLDDTAFGGARSTEAIDDLVFDPTRLSHGLHPSEDPLLRARSSIYAESHMRRTE